MTLHYRVNLQQKTGEDWKDAKLILSTSANDMLDSGVPRSESLVVQPKERHPPPPPPPPPVMRSAVINFDDRRSFSRSRRRRGRSPSYSPSSPSYSPFRRSPSPPPPPLMQAAAIVSKSPMAVSYTVDEHTTVPSDPLSYKVLVAIIPFEATISHITSPRKSPTAYLQVGTHLPAYLRT